MANKGVPGRKKLGLLKRKAPVEAIAALPPIVLGGVAAYNAATKSESLLAGIVMALAVLWLIFASAWKVFHAREQDAAAAEDPRIEGLTAALMVVQAAAARACGVSPDDVDKHLRVTFHRVVEPIENPDFIEQLVDYVGGNWNGAGRQFHVRCGIAGRAIREKTAFSMSYSTDDAEEKKRALKRDWGYTDHDLKSLSLDRGSMLAVPILARHGQEAVGVIYLDSDLRELFESDEVQEAILTACGGISNYVTRRYEK